jgi:hypothetical protein
VPYRVSLARNSVPFFPLYLHPTRLPIEKARHGKTCETGTRPMPIE